jgi:2-methylcitrate dehydratase PrpD
LHISIPNVEQVMREDKALTARLPGGRPARVTVRLTDGRVLSAESLTNRGDTEDPYSETEARTKFIELTPVWGRTRAEAVLQACETIDNADTLGDLMEMLAG